MKFLISLHNAVFTRLESALAGWAVPSLARLVFAGVLLVYYWGSAATKIGPGLTGIFHPTTGAFAQIFPKLFDAVNYDADKLPWAYHAIASLGAAAEFTLPALIVLGLLTRLASLGMIGFIAVQSFVDITGHDLAPDDIGRWFDNQSGALIYDQRAFWVFVLLVLVLRGAGPLSLDRVLRQWASG